MELIKYLLFYSLWTTYCIHIVTHTHIPYNNTKRSNLTQLNGSRRLKTLPKRITVYLSAYVEVPPKTFKWKREWTESFHFLTFSSRWNRAYLSLYLGDPSDIPFSRNTTPIKFNDYSIDIAKSDCSYRSECLKSTRIDLADRDSPEKPRNFNEQIVLRENFQFHAKPSSAEMVLVYAKENLYIILNKYIYNSKSAQ